LTELVLNRIVNVIMQSGQSVPDWMVRLPKPGKKKKKEMGRTQRAKASVGPKGENVGRAEALKKKYVIPFAFSLQIVVVESPYTIGK
jgi:ATP-dependent RNA helicase DDX52/ROK1